MIINGGSRSNALFFARHLSNEDENERVTLCDIRYLAAENVTDALHEMEIVALGTFPYELLYRREYQSAGDLTTDCRAMGPYGRIA